MPNNTLCEYWLCDNRTTFQHLKDTNYPTFILHCDYQAAPYSKASAEMLLKWTLQTSSIFATVSFAYEGSVNRNVIWSSK